MRSPDQREAEELQKWAEQYHKREPLPRKLRYALIVIAIGFIVGGYVWYRQSQREQERVATVGLAARCQEHGPSRQEFVLQAASSGNTYTNPQTDHVLGTLSSLKPGDGVGQVAQELGDPSYAQPQLSTDAITYEGCQWVYVLSADNSSNFFEERDAVRVSFNVENKLVDTMRKQTPATTE